MIEVKEFTIEDKWDKIKLRQYISKEIIEYIFKTIKPKQGELERDKACWMRA